MKIDHWKVAMVIVIIGCTMAFFGLYMTINKYVAEKTDQAQELKIQNQHLRDISQEFTEEIYYREKCERGYERLSDEIMHEAQVLRDCERVLDDPEICFEDLAWMRRALGQCKSELERQD